MPYPIVNADKKEVQGGKEIDRYRAAEGDVHENKPFVHMYT
jgi:hypothetical protein